LSSVSNVRISERLAEIYRKKRTLPCQNSRI
jgi:hypothetical protein